MNKPFRVVRRGENRRPHVGLHGGRGEVEVQFLDFADALNPAFLLTYRLAPGASEGAHRHGPDDPVEGSFEEVYFVLAGEATLWVDGEAVRLAPGDCAHVANGAVRGVENPSPTERLDLLLVVVRR